jgi:hypothetical protein
VGQAGLRKAVIDMPPEEMGRLDGLRVVISRDGQEAILGKIVASGLYVNGMANLGMFQADEDALERLRLKKRIEDFGFGKVVSGEPTYWFAGG